MGVNNPSAFLAIILMSVVGFHPAYAQTQNKNTQLKFQYSVNSNREPCSQASILDDAECSILQVLIKVPGDDNPEINITTYLPVSLKCPDENSGVLELTAMNQKGGTVKIQMSYASGKPPYVYLGTAPKDAEIQTILSVNPSKQALDERDTKRVELITFQANSVMTKVCKVSKADKKCFDNEIANNNAFLKERASSKSSDSENYHITRSNSACSF